MNFLISILLLAVSLFLMIVSVRYGLVAAGRLDRYMSAKNNSGYTGFQVYYRIPTSAGVIPEYFYALILGHDSYFSKNWWSLKTASFISILLFFASLKSRSTVISYYSFEIIRENGLSGLFNSGTLVNFLNIITLLYLTLFILICIESISMHGIYSPARIFAYSFLIFLMADITIITLYLIVVITIIYLIIKVIWFLFFSSGKRKNKDPEEETAGTILSGGFRDFKADLYDWEETDRENPVINIKKSAKKEKKRRPRIIRVRKNKPVSKDDEIPRLHPD